MMPPLPSVSAAAASKTARVGDGDRQGPRSATSTTRCWAAACVESAAGAVAAQLPQERFGHMSCPFVDHPAPPSRTGHRARGERQRGPRPSLIHSLRVVSWRTHARQSRCHDGNAGIILRKSPKCHRRAGAEGGRVPGTTRRALRYVPPAVVSTRRRSAPPSMSLTAYCGDRCSRRRRCSFVGKAHALQSRFHKENEELGRAMLAERRRRRRWRACRPRARQERGLTLDSRAISQPKTARSSTARA